MSARILSLIGLLALAAGCTGLEKRPDTTPAKMEAAQPQGEPYVDYAPEEQAWRSKRPTPGPAPEIEVPTFEETRLDNGLTLIVSRQPSLPLVSARVAVRAGSGAEPPEKAGLADLAYELLLEGAGELGALELADAFGDLGTAVGVGTGPDGASIGGDVLTRNLDPFLELLAQVVRAPTLAPDGFERQKNERLADLARMIGSPRYLAYEAVAETLYGEDHAYGHLGSGTPATVRSITLEDARDFLKERLGPSTTALVLTGDIDLETAKTLAEKHFGDWRSAAEPPQPPEAPALEARSRVVVVPKPGLGQTVIAVGRPAIPAGHPDEWALQVANAVYGGFFGSRLNMNLREDKGYTYGAFSSLDPRWGPGPFSAVTSVRADVTGASLAEVLGELEGLAERPITRSEFDDALSGIIRSVPGWFETVQGLSGSASSLFQERQPMDRYARMLEAYEGLELETVREAAARWFDPAIVRVILVGDPELIREQVGGMGLGELVTREPPAADGGAAPTAAR